MQLDRDDDLRREPDDAALLDLGVQDTGADGASWALACRGVPLTRATMPDARGLVQVWSLRGAPTFYRRSEVVDVHTAISPFNDADAGKRIFDANKPLKAAGIGARDALRHVAGLLREIVSEPTVKGDASGALSARLEQPYLRDCRVCRATHTYEQPFRFGALHAGLELDAGTSPPVLRRIHGWPTDLLGPADDPLSAPPRLQPIRAYLHLCGPATPQEVAAHLDAPVSVVKTHWPDEAVPVRVGGRTAYLLDGDLADLAAAEAAPTAGERRVRLLGPYDGFVQPRDREMLVPDAERRKELYVALGRPGAVVVDGAVIGTWRPRATGRRLSVRLAPWATLRRPVRAAIDEQAERLAAHRGIALAGIVLD